MQISQLIEFDQILPVKRARMLMGPAGLGKSSVVKMIAEKRGMGVVDLRLSELEPGDLVGMPFIEKVDGVAVTKYGAPEWWHELSKRPTILFLDEVDRAREDMQPLAMQLCLDRRAGGRNLPEDTIVYAAGNGLRYQTTSMDQALVNRFAMIDFEPTVEEWISWASAETSGVHQAVVQFITENNDALDTPEKSIGEPNKIVPTRRSWAFLGEALLSNKEVAKNLHQMAKRDLTLMLWAAPFVGQEMAMSFNNWVRDNYKPLDLKEVLSGRLKDPDGFTLPQLVDAIAPLCEIINDDKTSDDQRINAMKFYHRFSQEAFGALFERLDEKHVGLLQKPEVKEMVRDLIQAKQKFSKLAEEEKKAKEAKKAAKNS